MGMSLGNSVLYVYFRNLFDDKANTDPTQLAHVVEYIRRQVLHMDKLDSEQLLGTGEIELLPFKPAAPDS